MKLSLLSILAAITLLVCSTDSYSQCASNNNIYSFNYNSKSYKVVREAKTWTAAAACATSLGGYLIEINDQAEQNAVYSTLTTSAGVASNYTVVNDGGGIAYVWIGASDLATEGTWLWTNNNTNFWTGQGSNGSNNGVVVGGLYNNWGGSSTGAPKEPDNFSNNQDGAAIALAGWPAFNPGLLGVASEWNDINASNSIYFIVEYDCLNTTSTDTQSACNSYMWINGTTYTSSNSTATHILPNAAGCDSIITLNLTINNSSTFTDIQAACDSFTWIDNTTYTASNTSATVTLTNAAGCDSIVTLNLSLNTSTAAIDVQTACDSLTWIDGSTYTSNNNTATHTLTTFGGCDSVVTLNLTINSSSTGIDTRTACDSFTWIDGMTYTASNTTATHVLSNAAGCDSLVTLNLSLTNSSASTDTQTACDSFTWIDGMTYSASTTTATHVLTNAAGCDSVITLNLTLTNIDSTLAQSGVILTSNQLGASYQWLECDSGYTVIPGETNQSFTPTSTGNYAVAIALNGCADTSSCREVIFLDVEQNALRKRIDLFPNPTSGSLNLNFEQFEGKLYLTVWDMTGKAVSKKVYSGNQKVVLDLKGQPGIYFVEIVSQEASAVFKVVKQ